jgi:hypothetical protein
VKPPHGPQLGVDAAFAEILRLAANPPGLRALLARGDLDESTMIGVLRRAVPVPLLELVAATAPWSERPRVLGGVVLNPRTPRALAQRLLSVLYWHDLADAAVSPRLEGGVRARAEGLLKEQLVDLRLGEKVTLSRIATPPILRLLLEETDARILGAALDNPRLREADLAILLQGSAATRALSEAVVASSRWMRSYAVRLALVLQPKTPLALALGQITSLVPRDLRRLVETPGLPPLIQAAAARVAREAQEG